VRALEETFHETHRRVFAVAEPGQYLECLVWKARATAVTAKPSVSAREVGGAASQGQAVETGRAFFRDLGMIETPLYRGESLSPGARVAGPAIIREPTTTVVVYPGASATVTPLGNYLLDIGIDPEDLALAGVRQEVTAL
jgi:N-methylhydantoinase A